jgi:[ribosomal protein S18]-alanine N-acetyltransferase
VTIDGLFLERDREPSGFVISRRTLDEAEILSLALARTARGRGYSPLLLGCHLENLERLAIARVHLEVEEGNAPAIALYRRAGFVQSGRRPGYYARPDGTSAAALSMTLAVAERPAVIDGA